MSNADVHHVGQFVGGNKLCQLQHPALSQFSILELLLATRSLLTLFPAILRRTGLLFVGETGKGVPNLLRYVFFADFVFFENATGAVSVPVAPFAATVTALAALIGTSFVFRDISYAGAGFIDVDTFGTYSIAFFLLACSPSAVYILQNSLAKLFALLLALFFFLEPFLFLFLFCGFKETRTYKYPLQGLWH